MPFDMFAEKEEVEEEELWSMWRRSMVEDWCFEFWWDILAQNPGFCQEVKMAIWVSKALLNINSEYANNFEMSIWKENALFQM